MISGFNYSNNNNYNISNSNPNYIIQHNQNDLKAMYRDGSTFSNSTINTNKNKFVYYDYDLYPRNNINNINNINKKNGKHKTVKFDDKIKVIKVESYKKYNKIDDEINIDNILNNDYNYKQNGNKGKKKGDSCECKIV